MEEVEMDPRFFCLRIAGGVVAAVALSAAVAGAAKAQSGAIVAYASVSQAAATLAYWTPARLASAKPMEVHPSASFKLQPLEAARGSAVVPASSPANPGSNEPPGDTVLYQPAIQPGQGVERAKMNAGFFTESRVTPADAPASYPFRTIGKLFFTNPRSLSAAPRRSAFAGF
jgi:hypothetical protein